MPTNQSQIESEVGPHSNRHPQNISNLSDSYRYDQDKVMVMDTAQDSYVNANKGFCDDDWERSEPNRSLEEQSKSLQKWNTGIQDLSGLNDQEEQGTYSPRRAEGRGSYTDQRGSVSDSRGSYVDYRGSYADQRGSHADQRGSYADQRGSLIEPRGSHADSRGSYADQRGSLIDPRGSHADSRGSYADQRGSLIDPRGSHADSRGSYADQRGSYADHRGTNADQQGSQVDPRESYGDQQGAFMDQGSYAGSQQGSTADIHQRAPLPDGPSRNKDNHLIPDRQLYRDSPRDSERSSLASDSKLGGPHMQNSPRTSNSHQNAQYRTPEQSRKVPQNMKGPPIYENLGSSREELGLDEDGAPQRPPLPAAYRNQYAHELADVRTPHTRQDILVAAEMEAQKVHDPLFFQYPEAQTGGQPGQGNMVSNLSHQWPSRYHIHSIY